MILAFMQKFPWGEKTLFKEKILFLSLVFNNAKQYYLDQSIRPKIHTIRAGQRWRVGINIQMATGVRTKSYNQFNKDIPELSVVKSVQRIDILHRGPDCFLIFIDRKLFYSNHYKDGPGKQFNREGFLQFLQNDGITEAQFFTFFKKELRNGQLIHWTDLKY